MKKNYLVFVPVLAALVIGCSSGPTVTDTPAGVPDWFFNPPMQEDVIFGAGSAKMSDLNMSMTMAESRARQSIAFTLNANVQAMITDYTRNAGNTESQSNLSFAETVGRQLTSAKLTGATVYKRGQGSDGTVFVLVALKKADAAKSAAGIIETEAARYAEFKAMDALKMMDAQLEKTDIKPEPVTQ
ncbi:MAG: hypothetical protein LBU17_09110 [Treponema sp.]|jgi:uncharacterized protein YjbI with pentapeptide repeats|nr:hypothetical protein [Treponema sp.]